MEKGMEAVDLGLEGNMNLQNDPYSIFSTI